MSRFRVAGEIVVSSCPVWSNSSWIGAPTSKFGSVAGLSPVVVSITSAAGKVASTMKPAELLGPTKAPGATGVKVSVRTCDSPSESKISIGLEKEPVEPVCRLALISSTVVDEGSMLDQSKLDDLSAIFGLIVMFGNIGLRDLKEAVKQVKEMGMPAPEQPAAQGES